MDWIKVCICGAVVTPLAGVWVEILCRKSGNIACPVTPLAGVWVEIALSMLNAAASTVTPLAGVWVEMHKPVR